MFRLTFKCGEKKKNGERKAPRFPFLINVLIANTQYSSVQTILVAKNLLKQHDEILTKLRHRYRLPDFTSTTLCGSKI